MDENPQCQESSIRHLKEQTYPNLTVPVLFRITQAVTHGHGYSDQSVSTHPKENKR